MADIFISYSQKDRARVEGLVDALTAEGYEVWWDLKIRAGESFDELIESTLEKVSCVVGVWSSNAVKSEWVRAESAWAKDRGKFVSVRIDVAADLPIKFYHVHTASLANWDGSRDAGVFQSLLRDIQALAGAPKRTTDAGNGKAATEATTGPLQRPRPFPNALSRPPPETQAPKVAEPEVESPRPLAKSRRTPARKAQASEVLQPEMVRIEPGTFLMGSAKGSLFLGLFRGEGFADECPQHEVRIARPFGMGKYPLTFEEYDAFAKATKRKLPDDEGWGRGRRPVINVSWEDAVAYALWLSEQTGKRYRLPTEAVWEYAARAGTSTRWSFGDDKQALGKYAWHSGNSGSQTHPVGEKAANPWGLHDVHGNVWEWVQDCWHDSYQGAPSDGSAWEEQGGGECGRRVVRGGSWYGGPGNLRSAARHWVVADVRYSHLGFRLAQDPLP